MDPDYSALTDEQLMQLLQQQQVQMQQPQQQDKQQYRQENDPPYQISRDSPEWDRFQQFQNNYKDSSRINGEDPNQSSVYNSYMEYKGQLPRGYEQYRREPIYRNILGLDSPQSQQSGLIDLMYKRLLGGV